MESLTDKLRVSLGEAEKPRIGVYVVQEIIGVGGMGVVLRAFDPRLQRDVAIKLISEELVASPLARERFVREAKAMAKVRHENVVKIFALGEEDSVPFFAMEFVPGVDLESWYHQLPEPPSLDTALDIIDQVARGLDAIHRGGAVHADIKPGNIIVGPSFRVAITDFGLSRSLTELEDQRKAAGTPSYLAPEMLDPKAPMTPSADLFSLAVMAYELFTGVLPWPIETLEHFVSWHRARQSAPALSSFRPELTSGFDSVFMRALSYNPKTRFPTASAFVRALHAARDEVRDSAITLRIIAADDDDVFREILVATLMHAFPTAEIVAARNGDEALVEVQKHHTDLAVLDLDMPGLSGIELTETLRKNARYKDLPILVVSAEGGATDWQRLQELGANGFLAKPIQPTSLIATARRIVKS